MFRRILLLGAFVSLALGCTKKSESLNQLDIVLSANLNSLDPALSSNLYANMVVPNIYETLLEYHYLKRPLELEPLLAASLPTVSKDGLTYTFKLKQGVKFHDSEAFKDGKGRELVAQDFIYSWRRLADPKTKAEGWWIFDGRIKGFNEWREQLIAGKANYDTPIEGLQTPDDYTIVIKLTRPYYQLNYVLAMAYAAPVPKEAVDKWGEEFMNHPVGTGPYKFVSWIRGNKVELERNPEWHGQNYPSEGEATDKENGLLEDAGKPMPFTDRLVFHEITEDQPAWLSFMKGKIDFAGIPKDSFDDAIENKQLKPALAEKGMRLIIYPYMDFTYTGFNMEDPLLGKNRDLRLALCYAYDEQPTIAKFYNGRAITAHSPIAPSMEAYEEDFKNPCKETNLEKAKEHLKKAGYPDGKGLPVLEYNYPGSTTGRQMAEYVANQYAQIGVKLNLVSHSWPQFQDRLRTKKAQIFGLAWSADYPDPENMLQLLYGKNVSPGPNNTNYSNKEYDALYEKAAVTPPGPARTALYKKMRDIYVRDIPMITNVHRIGYSISHGWIHNLKRHNTLPGQYKYIRIDTKKKEELRAKL